MNDGPMDDAPKLMNFSEALTAVKATFGIARTGWNGKGLMVGMQRPDEHSANTLPYLFIKYPADHPTMPGARCPWLASQTDLLADDWFIVTH